MKRLIYELALSNRPPHYGSLKLYFYYLLFLIIPPARLHSTLFGVFLCIPSLTGRRAVAMHPLD